MTTIEERAHQYFYDLNSIARKIHQDIKVLQKNRTEIWNELDADKQEALLDQFFIDDSVRQKYAAAESADRSDSPVCFPKYVVNCGEKIVIDFDNDGWTWRDEHSAPFSWMSRSQQDLRFLGEDEDEGIEEDKTSEQQSRKRTHKSKSPERPDTPGSGGNPALAFKPEKSIWESPFLAADRGLDSAYPSSHASDQSRTSDESDDLSQKLAASLSVSIDEDAVDSQLSSPCNNDTSVLLDSGNHKTIDLSSARLELGRKGSGSSEDSTSSKGSHGKRKKDSSLVSKLWNPLKRNDEAMGVGGAPARTNSGQVSPVYLEEPGESSSDYGTPSTSTTQSSMTTFTFSSAAREEGGAEADAPSVGVHGVAPRTTPSADSRQEMNDFHSSKKKDDEDKDDEWKSELFGGGSSEVTTKTGFDFLDNW